VHPSGESLRVSFGVLNLTHRDGHERPAMLAVGQQYRVRIKLNDAGSVFPAGHRVRLALIDGLLAEIWPSPEKATPPDFEWHIRSAGSAANLHHSPQPF
jgi:predicted acyl esterase